ncbi:MAG: hypothetical protein IPJ95_04350 [Gemmatimonadetes bacterium]|nr:hypothetical protein [Gemmatimonadota bacterium]MBK7351330.1 hypothetical protein [Gemmatimonadota bacterium]MBK7786492.1 hypothetical protein [Gemmatimonadota bacterium]MBK7922850.1 hypothetical protein [Gemmatimonadota bacterium]MBK9065877.1 hypothetical protein [Gemmatimonadota bacterium]
MSKYFTRSLSGLALAGSALLAACGSDATGPGAGNGGSQFGSPMSVSQFDSTLGAGSTRIEIKLLAGGLEAREVHVEADDAEEKIVSQVTAIDTVAGTVTLALGGMQVSYGSGTRFRTPSDSRVTRAEWEAAIGGALGSGQQPPIEARRNQPGQPQAPTDASFTANDLRLEDKTDEPKIEVYVDADNFQDVASPPPLAILTVFNLPIEITSGTEISLTTPGGGVPSGSVEFEGSVTAADAGAGTITLAGGTVITVGSITFDPLGDLFSMDAVASAVAAGQAVRAEGTGTATGGSAITATTLKVEVDN